MGIKTGLTKWFVFILLIGGLLLSIEILGEDNPSIDQLKEAISKKMEEIETNKTRVESFSNDTIVFKAGTSGTERFTAGEVKIINHYIGWDPADVPGWAYFMQGYVKVEFDPAIVEVTGITSGLFDTWVYAQGHGYVILWTWQIKQPPPLINDPNRIAFGVNFKGKQEGVTNLTYATTNSSGGPRDWFYVGTAHYFMTVHVQVEYTLQLPVAPSNLVATPISQSQIDLEWLDNSNNEQGFVLERKTAEYGVYEPIAYIVPSNDDKENYNFIIDLSDRDINQDTTYYYRVIAYNESGQSDYSNEASAISFMSAPSDLVASPVSLYQIGIHWQDNSTSEDGFIIERRRDYEDFIPVATLEANATSFLDNGLYSGSRYYYQVKAYRTGNQSLYSIEASAITYRLTIGYLKDLVKRYYDERKIDDSNIYRSLIAKLDAIEKSAQRGNLTSYANQLNSFCNEVKVQIGKHIEINAGTILFNQAGGASELKAEIKGAGGVSPAPVYLPVNFPVTITGITSERLDGKYEWKVITAANTGNIKVTGKLTDTIKSGEPITKTALVIEGLKESSAVSDVRISFVFTPDEGKAVTYTATLDATVITTSFTAITTTSVPIIKPHAIEKAKSVDITDVGLGLIYTSAVINTTPTVDKYATQWELGYIQNVISFTAWIEYPKTIRLVTLTKFPMLDAFTEEKPILYPEPFTASGKKSNTSFLDEPKRLDIPWVDTQTSDPVDILIRYYQYEHFITWMVAHNKITGEIRFLWWVEWEIIYDIAFDGKKEIGKRATIKRPPTGTKIIAEGEGKGSRTPISTPPIANKSEKLITISK